jgi:hypothetical protein
MERTYEGAAALVDRAAGPLASHLGPFVTSLTDQQYTASVIYIKVRHALAFDRWLVISWARRPRRARSSSTARSRLS